MINKNAKYYKIAKEVSEGRMTQMEGAKALGLSLTGFRKNLDKDFPDRIRGSRLQSISNKHTGGRPVSKVSALEQIFSDDEMCEFLRSKEKCNKCPLYPCNDNNSKLLNELTRKVLR